MKYHATQKKFHMILWGLLFLCFWTPTVMAQKLKKVNLIEFKTTDTYFIGMKDETTFTGKFVEKNDTIVVFTTSAAKIDVRLDQIASVKVIDESRFVNGKYWFPNPHATRYLFSPTAFNLPKGEGYYQNIYGVVNSVTYGVSDHFTVGVGTELISLFSGYPVLILTPKVGGYQLAPKWKAGGGFLSAFTKDGFVGIGYGIVTQGTEDRNITLGLGWAFSSNAEVKTNPVMTISGMYRFSKNIAFISENWLIPFDGYTPFFSYGLRFFGERIAVDIALINSPDIIKSIAIGFPFVDFVYKF